MHARDPYLQNTGKKKKKTTHLTSKNNTCGGNEGLVAIPASALALLAHTFDRALITITLVVLVVPSGTSNCGSKDRGEGCKSTSGDSS